MAKEYEFRPDSASSGNLDKIFLTQRQRFSLWRWTLYGLLVLLGLIVQDVVLYRVNYQGAGTDLVPCLIFLITALEGGESGCVFALCCSMLYCFSGSAPGPHVIPMVTVLAVLAAIFRQACLRRGFLSIFICTAGALFLYELILFAISWFMGYMPYERMQVMLMTAGVTLVAVPVVYPLARIIGKIGGEPWKE